MMLRLAALLERFTSPPRREAPARPAPPVRRRATPKRRQPRPVLLEQLVMDLGPAKPRWTFSRLVARSPHHAAILERLEQVRRFFPELAGVPIHVGLVKKPGVLGWGSLDPERPGIWVRPRRTHLFTIAHEFTHLLQARGLVPRGERSCDLYALARSPLLIDHAPGYLRLPAAMRRGRLDARHAQVLHACAKRALVAREAGDRRYLTRFEREVATEVAGG